MKCLIFSEWYKELSNKLFKVIGPVLPDKKYLKIIYKQKTGHKLDINCPKTYTEKLQWLKLYDRRPEYTMMQDKYLVRGFVQERIGSEYLVPLLGVWDNADEIDFESLPGEFVLKCNHDCASVVICRDKSVLNIANVKEKLNRCLKRNYYLAGREWAYKDIKPKIIAEKYLKNNAETTLTDYKIFCFSGKARMVLLASGEAHTEERRTDYYDTNLEHLPIKRGSMSGAENIAIEKPEGFEKLIPLAEKISEGIPFLRVDFYLVNGQPYFGELAFYPSAGFAEFSPYEWEKKIGDWIVL